MSWRRGWIPAALSALLGACASQPSSPPAALPQPPLIRPAPTPAAAPPTGSPSEAPADVWDSLRSSFAMDDCDADPGIMHWATRYTRAPARFESQLQAVLPRLAYVQKIASRYDVAGEFVLLPWVESRFQPVPARKHRPAGMWQIMPVTAGAMGLRVDGHYDGRLDLPAAANAVMKLLQQYHQQFEDWGLADYAYNAGEFAIRKIIRQHGMPSEHQAVPDLPVRKVTREHLTKLLAIACVIREPQRFHVQLPDLPDERRLVKTPLPQSMPIARAADHAGMTVDALQQFNGAFRSDVIDKHAAPYLILPAEHARQFRDAMLDPDNRLPASTGTDATPAAPRTYTVKPGDSLWQIARRNSVSIRQLQQWNSLRGHVIKPGLVLKLEAP